MNSRLAALLTAWLAKSCGDWAFVTATAVYAFHRAGAGGVAAVTAARWLPALAAAPASGGLIDRGDRARVVALACAGQAACLGGVAAVALADGPLSSVVVLMIAFSITASAPRPALQALMPALAADPEELTRATALWGAIDNGAFLLGGGLGGIAIAAVGDGAVLAAAAGALALAAALAFRLPAVTATVRDDDADEAAILDGVRAVLAEPLLGAAFALFAGLLALEGTTDVQIVALALGPLRLGSGGAGIMFAVWGAGGVAGSALILRLVRRRGYGLVLAMGGVVFGLALAVAGIPWVGIAIAAMVPAGIGFAFVETAMVSVIPRLTDDAVAGRVFALSEMLYAGAGGVGALLTPLLIDATGVAGSLVAVGVTYAVCTALAWPVFVRLDRGQEVAGRVRELVRGVSFLAPLPLPRLERLVRDARVRQVDAGEVIVRLGERGDEFFLIEAGEVEIVEFRSRMGAGEGFGEIALLHDVPRAATVRAAEHVHLWVFTRRAFIGAVSAHSDAIRLAEAVIAEHLSRPRPDSAL